MTTVSTQQRSIEELAAATERLARDLHRDDLADAVAATAAAFSRGSVTLAVAGEVKRGKTSLINALLDAPGLLPVDTTVTTSLVTTISYAETERVTVLAAGSAESKTITREAIVDYVTERGNPGNIREAQLVTLELPNEKLRQGLVIADTPGVGGIIRGHAAVTYSFILTADVVLFVLDALAPLTTAELDFIASIHERASALVFAMTKIDKELEYDTLIENARSKLASTLGIAPNVVPIIGVSSLAKADYLESGDVRDLEDSNFPALEDALWTLLRRNGKAALTGRTLGELLRTVDGLLGPVQAELDAYSGQSASELDAEERELRSKSARIGEHAQLGASWRATLRADAVLERTAADKQLESGIASVLYELTAVLQDDRALEDPALAIGPVDAALARLSADLSAVIERRKGALAHRVASSTLVPFNPLSDEVKLDARATAPAFSIDRTRTDVGEKILQGVVALPQGATMGGTAAFAIASLLSISNPIGWVVLGTALGAGAILSREARQMRNQDADAGRLELERLLSRYIHECASQLRSGLDAAWTQVEETLESGMDYALRSERERLDGSAAALADARQRAGEAAVVRAAALRGPLEQLNAIREDVVRRGEEVSRQLRPGPADAAT